MANIKSAKKRILTTATRTARNKAGKSKVKTCIKKVEMAVEAGNKEEAIVALREAQSQIHKACKKSIYHANNAGRKISRLNKLVNTLG